MAFKREDINGTSPLDMKKLNDNVRNLWSKVFGDINFSDLDKNIQNRLYTNWITPNGDGNLDTQHPYVIKFFIPPDTKKINTAKLSIETSSYRMDSIVTEGGGGVTDSPVLLSLEGGTAIINEANTTTNYFKAQQIGESGITYIRSHSGRNSSRVDGADGTVYEPGETFVIPVWQGNTGGSFSGRELSLNTFYVRILTSQLEHTHNIEIKQALHSHTGTARVTIPNHPHNLKAGIFEGGELPNNVRVKVNGVDVGIVLNGLTAKNDIDIADKLIIGQLNRIEVSCGLSATGKLGTARASVFGMIELTQVFRGNK